MCSFITAKREAPHLLLGEVKVNPKPKDPEMGT
jgi:hypothetical protein